MSEHTDEHLPPELSDVAERLRASRPAASDLALDGAMTRAQRARPRRRSSLLWASAPRMTPKMRGIAAASALAIVGMTAGAAIVNSSGSGGSGLPSVNGDAAQDQYCEPGLVFFQAQLAAAEELLNIQLALPPAFQDPILIAALQAEIAELEAQILVCIQLGNP